MGSPLLTQSATSRVVLKLEQPAAWPAALQTYLGTRHELFLGWETGTSGVPAALYDKAICGLMDALQPYAIRGWHCTRLTDSEIDEIQRNGMQLPNAAMLTRRIESLVEVGQLASATAQQLITKNQAADANRAKYAVVLLLSAPPSGRKRHRALLSTLGRRGIVQFARGRSGHVPRHQLHRNAEPRGSHSAHSIHQIVHWLSTQRRSSFPYQPRLSDEGAG